MAILQQNPPRLCNRLRRQLRLCLRTVGVQTVRSPETSQLGNAVFIGMQLPLGSPLLMNQPLQFPVTGLGRIVRPQQTAGRILNFCLYGITMLPLRLTAFYFTVSHRGSISQGARAGFLCKQKEKRKSSEKRVHFGVFGTAYRHPARMAGAPFPYCQFFQIYGNKLKLHPVCHLGQASVLRVTHAVLLLRVGKHTLDFLFSQPVQLFIHRYIPDMLRHLHIVLPDMAQHGFLALGVFGAHPPGGIGFAKILPALVFPVVLPFCGEIHHYTAFSPHLREKGHRKVTFFDRLQVISYILDKLYFYFAAIGLGGQREWFWYGFCVELAGGYVDR